MKFIFIYITCKDKRQASRISLHLLNKKLIACSNIFPIESIYQWKGKLNEEKEIVLIGKTTSEKYKSIIKEVESVHSYECPCIIQIPIHVNKKYGNWLLDQLK